MKTTLQAKISIRTMSQKPPASLWRRKRVGLVRTACRKTLSRHQICRRLQCNSMCHSECETNNAVITAFLLGGVFFLGRIDS